MISDGRWVFDTGVIVSALLLPRSVPRRAFDRAFDQGKMLVSAATVAELNDVLRRSRFDKYLREDERLEFLNALVREARFVNTAAVVTECRDPKDNKFLELALSGRATCLVSGDQDLLTLDQFRGVPILSPRAFLVRPW